MATKPAAMTTAAPDAAKAWLPRSAEDWLRITVRHRAVHALAAGLCVAVIITGRVVWSHPGVAAALQGAGVLGLITFLFEGRFWAIIDPAWDAGAGHASAAQIARIEDALQALSARDRKAIIKSIGDIGLLKAGDASRLINAFSVEAPLRVSLDSTLTTITAELTPARFRSRATRTPKRSPDLAAAVKI